MTNMSTLYPYFVVIMNYVLLILSNILSKIFVYFHSEYLFKIYLYWTSFVCT